MLWPDQQGGRRVEEGVAIITMSSNVGFNLAMQRWGLPIAYMLSLGNKLKFDLHDAIRVFDLSLIHISEPTRQESRSRMPSSA